MDFIEFHLHLTAVSFLSSRFSRLLFLRAFPHLWLERPDFVFSCQGSLSLSHCKRPRTSVSSFFSPSFSDGVVFSGFFHAFASRVCKIDSHASSCLSFVRFPHEHSLGMLTRKGSHGWSVGQTERDFSGTSLTFLDTSNFVAFLLTLGISFFLQDLRRLLSHDSLRSDTKHERNARVVDNQEGHYLLV